MKQKPQVAPVAVEQSAPPAPVTRLSQEEMAQLHTTAHQNYQRFLDYGGDGVSQLLSLLLFDLLEATQQQNQLLTRIADAMQPGQEKK